MKINLSELGYKDKIEIDEVISYPSEYLENSDIKKLDNVKVNGYFKINDIDEYVCNLHVKGTMDVLDSVTLDAVPLDFDFVIEENLDEFMQKNQNMLDIMELLWQNIVLEVPIRYTKSDAKKLSGENWTVTSDDKEKIDPRMQDLYKFYKGGE